MNKLMKSVLKNGLGAVGDKMNERLCPLFLYQPQACARGEKAQKDEAEMCEKTQDVE